MLQQITSGPEWDHMLAWTERISQPLAENNGWPICPYARKAMVSKSIKVWRADDLADLYRVAETFEMRAWAIDIVILPGAENIDDLVDGINWNFEPVGVYALADDPAKPGDIAGHNPSNGKYPVIILQDLEDLMHKRASLRSTNYYSTWSDWYKDYVLNSKSDLS